jgi:tRNA threonylcarbamoyladenosine biosynthesis protein TsaB
MKPPRIIAIETSGRRGSVALALGPDLVGRREFSADMQHARDLLPEIDRLCREHQWRPDGIDQCYLSIGPGSFTGLRVAVAFARHFALATAARTCAVPTLDVIAENGRNMEQPPEHLAVMLDAKRGQVFMALFVYDGEVYRRTVGPRMAEPAAMLAAAPAPLAVIGEGIAFHRSAVEASKAQILDSSLWWPTAAGVHQVGWRMACAGAFTEPTRLVPDYLRRPEAEELWEKRHGTES